MSDKKTGMEEKEKFARKESKQKKKPGVSDERERMRQDIRDKIQRKRKDLKFSIKASKDLRNEYQGVFLMDKQITKNINAAENEIRSLEYIRNNFTNEREVVHVDDDEEEEENEEEGKKTTTTITRRRIVSRLGGTREERDGRREDRDSRREDREQDRSREQGRRGFRNFQTYPSPFAPPGFPFNMSSNTPIDKFMNMRKDEDRR